MGKQRIITAFLRGHFGVRSGAASVAATDIAHHYLVAMTLADGHYPAFHPRAAAMRLTVFALGGRAHMHVELRELERGFASGPRRRERWRRGQTYHGADNIGYG